MYYVYRFLDEEHNVIYVGRTTSFTRRMAEHFSGNGHLPKEAYLTTRRVEFIKVPNELDMTIIELILIGKYRPEYNVRDNYSSSPFGMPYKVNWEEYIPQIDYDVIVKGGIPASIPSNVRRIEGLIDLVENHPSSRRTYVSYAINLLTYCGKGAVLYLNKQSRKPLNRTGVAKVLNIKTRASSKEFIDLMLDLGVISETKTLNGKGFEVSKEWILRDRTRYNTQVNKLKKVIRGVFEENNPSHARNVYTILFRMEDLGTSLDLSYLSNITERSAKVTYRTVQETYYNKENIFLREGKSSRYVINPELVDVLRK